VTPEVAIVTAWHAALNAHDVERLLALSSAEVEVGGPRGTARGASVLSEWVDRANVHLKPLRIFQRGPILVVPEDAEWRADDGSPTGAQQVGAVFEVRLDRVARVVRYPDLASALAAAGLSLSDEVAAPGWPGTS
jgi:limonene-1,2-epoxide hydrolase